LSLPLLQSHAHALAIQIDVDDCSDAAAQNSIRGVPTFQFRNGATMMDEFVGASPDDISQRLKALSDA
jgi:thioredoxin-like negative regulator of GroEL